MKSTAMRKIFKIIMAVVLLGIIHILPSRVSAQEFYNVLKYGSKNDSSKIATEAIKNAIDAASKAGGGTVYFPAGKYLTGPIHLKSNITLFIDAGAVLYFSDNFDDYLPMVQSRWEGTDVINFSPLFYAHKAENISIIGRGIIDGNGKKWWDFHHKLYDKNVPRSKWQEEFARNNKNVIKPDVSAMIDRGFLRPPFIQPMYCKNVLIQGITIRNSPFWTVNPEFCENVTITGVTINNPDSPNTDGINPESCKYVHISDCHISVGDDCITIKSGKDRAGRKMAAPAENYTITNCTMLSGHGGVVIGSEMSGGVKKITISNCIFDGTDRGIRIKTARGRGGVVEDIRVDNVIMKNIRDEAIVLNMFYQKSEPEPVSERTPQFKNIHFSNITAQTNRAVLITGIEEMPVEDITFHDIQFNANTGIEIREARNIELHNVRVTTTTGPALFVENVGGIEIDGVRSMNPLAETPMLRFKNVQDVFLHSCFPPERTETFVELQGNLTRHVTIRNNNFLNVKSPLKKGEEISEKITIE
jgi:polygalacturonase